MIQGIFLTVLFLFVEFNLAFSMNNMAFEKIGRGIQDSEIRCLAVHPDNETIYAGTSEGIYKSLNQGKDFSSVFQTFGSGRGVNFLYINLLEPNSVYAATNSGLFLSTDHGEHWQGVFHPPEPRARQCLSVAVNERTIYVGTLDGLFIKEANESLWHKRKELSSDVPVTFITRDSQYFYFATPTELWRGDKLGQTYQKVFAMSSRETNVAAENTDSPDDVEMSAKQIKFVAMPPAQDGFLYLATTKGIFFSDSHGGHWESLAADSLPFEEVTSLLAMKMGTHPSSEYIKKDVSQHTELLVGTTKGLFRYKEDKWTQLYQGLETNEVNYLAADNSGQVYLAADSGIFLKTDEKTLADNVSVDYADIERKFVGEPTIGQTQAMAVDYAEVHPDKIKSWRRRADRKAIFPTVSVGLDRSASEFFHWDTGGNPDTLLKGKDFLEWDVSVSWNLGELIWNNDQTSIDSRSKLMVELREDVLDQVTRLYFERRRLQTELMSAAETAGPRFDKQMRVAELTALIDAFTGGEFSRYFNKVK